MAIKHFSKGAGIGRWQTWDRQGNIVGELIYSAPNKPEGKWVEWSILYYKEFEYEYKNGLKSGLWIQYYSNGEYDITGEYLNDKKIGEWTYWDIEGGILKTEKYDNDGNLISVEKILRANPVTP